MALLRQIASLWSFRDYPSADTSWGPEAQLDSIRSAGFDGVTDRVAGHHGKLARECQLIVVGFVSSGDDTEFGRLLDTQREAGARHVNVQLADHDTSTREALRLTHRSPWLHHVTRWADLGTSLDRPETNVERLPACIHVPEAMLFKYLPVVRFASYPAFVGRANSR
jgi:hypothetical protein